MFTCFVCIGCDETPVGCHKNVSLSPQDVASIGRQIAVEMSMSGSGKKKKKYSRSNLLSKKMLSLHHLWGLFRVTLPETAPQYNVNWSRSETLVSNPSCVMFFLLLLLLFLFLSLTGYSFGSAFWTWLYFVF